MTPQKDPWRASVEERLEALEALVTSQDEEDPGLLQRTRDVEQRLRRWDRIASFVSGGNMIGLLTVLVVLLYMLNKGAAIVVRP